MTDTEQVPEHLTEEERGYWLAAFVDDDATIVALLQTISELRGGVKNLLAQVEDWTTDGFDINGRFLTSDEHDAIETARKFLEQTEGKG